MPLLLNTDQNSLVRLYTPFPEVGVEVRQVDMLTHLDWSENPLSSKKTFCKRLRRFALGATQIGVSSPAWAVL